MDREEIEDISGVYPLHPIVKNCFLQKSLHDFLLSDKGNKVKAE